MEAEQYQQQQEESPSYFPSREDMPIEGMLSKHLDSKEVLTSLKMMLLGYEQDTAGNWTRVEVDRIPQGEGKEDKVIYEEPLMPPAKIRMLISYLHGFLNSNTFLSRTKEDRINDIMWDVSKTLATIFFTLRYKIDPQTRKMLWGVIEYPILMGLNRSGDMITLNAATKIQQSIERIGEGSKQQDKKEGFEVFGLKG